HPHHGGAGWGRSPVGGGAGRVRVRDPQLAALRGGDVGCHRRPPRLAGRAAVRAAVHPRHPVRPAHAVRSGRAQLLGPEVEDQMKQARNGDVMLTWEETGSGFPILLIQGLGYARWSWEDLVPQLADRHRVISFDNRGIGDSSKPQGPYSVAQMAGDALAVLDAAEVDRAHVVGASLGGMVAQELTLAHPERV